ncbi:MAG: hypothetical protein NC541_15305 [bacterium]|nr:hypothetical protein [bacterium]
MCCKRADGRDYEADPNIAAYENATESSLVLHALRDALQRLKYACEVVVHTDCSYIAAAIGQGWPEVWAGKNWKNSRGEEVKDSVLWDMILEELEEGGHILRVEKGKHEYRNLMRWKLQMVAAYRDVFMPVRDWRSTLMLSE